MPDRRRSLSLRSRMVLLGTVTAALVLVLGGILLGVAVRRTLLANTRDIVVRSAQDISGLVVQGGLPTTIRGRGDESLVQVVDTDGRVLASTANMRHRDALDLPAPPAGRTSVREVDSLPVDDDQAGFLVATSTVTAPRGPVAVHVAASLDDISESIVATNTAALATLPVVVAALAGLLWLLVGRTLAPVAAMTAEADEIRANAMDRRLPEPDRADEIGVLARTLNRMLERLDAAAQRQRRFVADASHELRAPITNLRAQLETARQHADDVDWTQTSAELLEEIVRIQRLAEQLLLLARLDGTGFTPSAAPVDVDDVVDRVVIRWSRRGKDVGVDGVEPVQLPGDAALLEHAVGNLVDNAVRHAASVVRVGLRRAGGTAVVVVDDDGHGIPADLRDEVLRPFTRLDAARDRDAGGAGLGLAIAADIAAVHRGSVEIDDSPLGGARVRLVLRDDAARA